MNDDLGDMLNVLRADLIKKFGFGSHDKQFAERVDSVMRKLNPNSRDRATTAQEAYRAYSEGIELAKNIPE